jgi:REP element-mobilizing transposase RayT
MTRDARVQAAGGIYHVTMRGNNRGPIFFAEGDRDAFLDTLARTRRLHGWRVHAFCLMNNHYHLLIETPEPNIAKGMQWLNSVYAHRTNQRHERIGHLFQRRYGAELIQDDGHLHEVIRYIPLNPVRAGLCDAATSWKWSSYAATMDKAPRPPFLSVHWTLRRFGDEPGIARARLEEWVEEGRRLRPRNDVQEPLGVLLPPGREASAEMLAAAKLIHCHSVRSIARHLRVDPATVSRRIRPQP